MKIKTAELTGTALDWAVAKCEGFSLMDTEGYQYHETDGRSVFLPSTNWAQGGPIIEREKITISDALDEWVAGSKGRLTYFGPTPLSAAMRCYVASKLGDEVDIPAELVQSNPI